MLKSGERQVGVKKQRTSLDKVFIKEIREFILSARQSIVRNIDTIQVITNFEIGRRIVEYEQKGENRAEYGKQLIIDISINLTTDFGKGFSERNLRNMRKFYLVYQNRYKLIRQMPSAKLNKSIFSLSWSQYIFLISIKDKDIRNFYEIEAANNNWTLPELTRQFNSGLYERLLLSRDKEAVKKLSKQGQVIAKPEDLLKEPYVLEFLGLDENIKYSESDLETAIINKLEHFLLELGKGFLFEARQKRFTFNEDHFFVDLVFYNRLLNCVEITLPKDANIHAKEYQLYLPSKQDLKQKLLDWTNEEKGTNA